MPRLPDDDIPGAFGSDHQGVSHFAFLDGSVRRLSHDVDALVMLSAIGDGGYIPEGLFDD
ncbi:MAG: H-X9-DG-CTERM domain-containing protein [Planctomycetota bacterium]